MPFFPLISQVGLLACAALLSAGAAAAEPSAPTAQKTAAQPQKTEAPLSFDDARTPRSLMIWAHSFGQLPKRQKPFQASALMLKR